MTAYTAPLPDFRFVLEEVLPSPQAPGTWAGHADVLQGFAAFCEGILAPLNRSGDEEGCRFEAGQVRVPHGVAAAYAKLRADGWAALGVGGEGAVAELPASIEFCADEIAGGANLAFSNYLGPTKRVHQALRANACAALPTDCLRHLADGHWSGTLCLTEPQCGTDLGLIRTRAVPDGAAYRLSGTKIFVTSGQHGLTDNIVHLVLARLAGSPAGIRGLSLFLVPRTLPESGAANGVECVGIEHKMGIRASATCTMQFEQARGWLVGAVDGGLRALFPVMERERLVIAMQSLGVSEAAYQRAVAYSRERLQGRAPAWAQQDASLAADPIIAHPDVRRMLLTMRCLNEGMRAVALWVASAMDEAAAATDGAERKLREAFVQLAVPMVKAFFTDTGTQCTALGMQVMGGHGYIRESGMEQLSRDVRVTQLYAGANGIQALDLVGRKLAGDEGRAMRAFIGEVLTHAGQTGPAPEAAQRQRLRTVAERLQAASAYLLEARAGDANLAGAVGHAYLHLFGHTAMAYLWSRAAAAAREALARGRPAPFYEAKLATGRFYFEHVLPQSEALYSSIAAGSGAVMAIEEAAL